MVAGRRNGRDKIQPERLRAVARLVMAYYADGAVLMIGDIIVMMKRRNRQ